MSSPDEGTQGARKIGDPGAPPQMRTPWGDIEELSARRMRPGPGAEPGERDRSQRERLYAATVLATTKMGYRAVRVADLLSIAGVSRASFYRHFDDKGDCFRATVKALLDGGLQAVDAALEPSQPLEQRMETAVRAVLDMVAAEPAAARLCLLDSYAAGRDGFEPIEAALRRACDLAHDVLGRLPGHERSSPEIALAVIGGMHRVLYTYLSPLPGTRG
jgi:AcrR family transcriptional regulator